MWFFSIQVCGWVTENYCCSSGLAKLPCSGDQIYMYSRLLGKHERNPDYALVMTDWAVGRHNIVAHAIVETLRSRTAVRFGAERRKNVA